MPRPLVAFRRDHSEVFGSLLEPDLALLMDMGPPLFVLAIWDAEAALVRFRVIDMKESMRLACTDM
jgi:hypothetical protein